MIGNEEEEVKLTKHWLTTEKSFKEHFQWMDLEHLVSTIQAILLTS